MIFDDSCKETFNGKKFVKIATSGRHRKLHVIYVKQNLFLQSKWSRTIDLNTTQVVLFKSLCVSQQIHCLGKLLNWLQFLTEAYKFARAESYGHLVIDLDPKTAQGLRFSSNFIGPEPTVFYFPSQEADITTLANEKKKTCECWSFGALAVTRNQKLRKIFWQSILTSFGFSVTELWI